MFLWAGEDHLKMNGRCLGHIVMAVTRYIYVCSYGDFCVGPRVSESTRLLIKEEGNGAVKEGGSGEGWILIDRDESQ